MNEKECQYDRIFEKTIGFGRPQLVRKIQMQINDNKKKDKEIERLNNVIDELEEWIMEDVKDGKPDLYFQVVRKIDILDKLKELKGSDE
jgi:hypothetical protein